MRCGEEKSPRGGRVDTGACGDGLGGFGGGTEGVLVAAGVEGDVGDDGRRAVVGAEACGGKGDATISRIPVENWPAGWGE